MYMYVGTSGQPTFYRVLGKNGISWQPILPYNIGTLGNLLVPTESQHFTEWSVKFRIHHLKIFYCPLLLFQAPLFRLPVLPRVQRDEQQSDEAWNDCLIYFVPLLCSLVESTAESWREMLQDEQGGLLLYQQNLSQIQEVCFLTGTSFSAATTQWEGSQSHNIYEPYAPYQEVSNSA